VRESKGIRIIFPIVFPGEYSKLTYRFFFHVYKVSAKLGERHRRWKEKHGEVSLEQFVEWEDKCEFEEFGKQREIKNEGTLEEL